MLKIDFINVGYGDATLLRVGDFAMLVDCGDEHVGQGPMRISAAEYLRREGVSRIDCLLISHLHKDHVGGIGALIGAVEVGELWASYLPPCPPSAGTEGAGAKNLADALRLFYDAAETLKRRGCKLVELGGAPSLTREACGLAIVLDPPEKALCLRQKRILDDYLAGRGDALAELDGFINDVSLRLRLIYRGVKIDLPGDARAACRLRAGVHSCDVLKLSHHGHPDSLSPALLDALRPAYAIISVSNDRADCPAPEILKALQKRVPHLYFTDAVRTPGTEPEEHLALRMELGACIEVMHVRRRR